VYSSKYQPTAAAPQGASQNPHKEIDRRTSEERLADYTLWLERFTGLLAVVSAVQIGFLFRGDKTARLTALAAKESADSLRALERGYAAIKLGIFYSGMKAAGKVDGIEMTLINTGRTFITIHDMCVVFDYGDTLPDRPVYSSAEAANILDLDSILAANDSWTLDKPIRFRAGTNPFCYGRVRYRDVFDKKWTYRFSVKIDTTKSGGDSDRTKGVGPAEFRADSKGWDEDEK